MENIVYNELKLRGFSVDVGVVVARERNKSNNVVRVPKEIDFVASKGGKRVYIQSAYAMPDVEKSYAENKPFTLLNDSFPKIIVRHDISKKWYDENGVLNIGIIDFLLDDTII